VRRGAPLGVTALAATALTTPEPCR
jgi:hypothetical protein